MFASFSIFDVHRVEVSAHSITLSIFADKPRAHYQKLEFFDSRDQKIGEIMVQLDRPMAALAVGDCSELDGFQAPAPAPALPAPALRLVGQVGGF
jgi:hypothetical protein